MEPLPWFFCHYIKSVTLLNIIKRRKFKFTIHPWGIESLFVGIKLTFINILQLFSMEICQISFIGTLDYVLWSAHSSSNPPLTRVLLHNIWISCKYGIVAFVCLQDYHYQNTSISQFL